MNEEATYELGPGLFLVIHPNHRVVFTDGEESLLILSGSEGEQLIKSIKEYDTRESNQQH